MTLKLSVLASGEVLLDGQAITLDALDQKLESADKDSTAVWYYREAAGKEPPPSAMAVIQLVVKHKLRISMSSKPDFSDYVDAKGVSHPRVAPETIRMPEVTVPENLAEVFENIRNVAAGDKGQGGLVIVRADRTYLMLPPIAESPELKKFADGLAKLFPRGVQRRVAVITCTEFPSRKAGIAEINKSIPFFGLLMGLAYLGHAVCIFEGHASALAEGCRGADALIVDSAMLPLLAPDWKDTARGAMRSPNILVHDRATFQLRALSKLGDAKDRLEFADQPFRA